MPERYYVTIRPAYVQVVDEEWAAVFRPGTPMLVNGGVPLRIVLTGDGELRGRLQHLYYPPVVCAVPRDVVDPLQGPPAFRGCVADPRCVHEGVRRRVPHGPCTCMGCWAQWWQRRAAEEGLAYPIKGGGPQWVTSVGHG